FSQDCLADITMEALGIPGKQDLVNLLTSATNPVETIESFQHENGLLLPSVRCVLPLLQYHGTRLHDFHQSVLELMRERLLARINGLGEKSSQEKDKILSEILSKSFPVVKIPALRPVVMAALKNITKVDSKYLVKLMADTELYRDCDIEVKRQIWMANNTLFGEEVTPILNAYAQEKEESMLKIENVETFFGAAPKVRRQGKIVQDLVRMIGRSVVLYDMVLQFIRTLLLRKSSVHFCTLRAELLMALHDAEVQEITTVDPCHKFTWCLDACIREKNVDSKKSRELQSFLDGMHGASTHKEVLGDIAMVLCDPHSRHFLCASILRILNSCILHEQLPRENNTLVLLLRLLSLGLKAIPMIQSQVFVESKISPTILTSFMPSLIHMMVDDQVRSIHNKLPLDERQSAIMLIEHSGPAPDGYEEGIRKHRVAAEVAVHYVLMVAQKKDRGALLRSLGGLAISPDGCGFESSYLHTLVLCLIHLKDEFSQEDFCTAVFDEFFLTGLTQDHVLRQLLKLVWYIHSFLPPGRKAALMGSLEQGAKHIIGVHDTFLLLEERVKGLHPPRQPETIIPAALHPGGGMPGPVSAIPMTPHPGSPSPYLSIPTPSTPRPAC
ncbi:unnamed protein product, partial [Cyprideis torosa]